MHSLAEAMKLKLYVAIIVYIAIHNISEEQSLIIIIMKGPDPL